MMGLGTSLSMILYVKVQAQEMLHDVTDTIKVGDSKNVLDKYTLVL